jgi:tRNA threonylcarbamoyladenosine biosynthesis protein TsaE
MPILAHHSLEIISRSSEQTRRVGMRLGALIQSGDVICLNGDLGSGKTTLVQGISAGWGSVDAVSSPTFVLVNVYRRPDGKRLYHLDAYRLKDAQEAVDLDLDVMLDNGPLVIEWAERVRDALPQDCLAVSLKYVDEDQRDLLFEGRSFYYQALLANFRKVVYGG